MFDDTTTAHGHQYQERPRHRIVVARPMQKRKPTLDERLIAAKRDLLYWRYRRRSGDPLPLWTLLRDWWICLTSDHRHD